jgi:molecular chaperone GrpE (heat shock protein)
MRAVVGPALATLDQTEKGVADLVKRLTQVGDHLVELRHLFAEKIEKDETQREAFNKLYKEMTLYRDNFLFAAEKPLFMALILLYDTISRAARQVEENAAALEAVENIKAELLDVLYRQDVDLITERPEKLDIGLQKVIRREETSDPAEDLRVVEVVRDGFRWNGKIIRPQEVVVKRRLAAASP